MPMKQKKVSVNNLAKLWLSTFGKGSKTAMIKKKAYSTNDARKI